MAGITQTIPQFTAGISEQPDHLKFPGQVKDVINAIPDVTRGLFKRPGAKRVGTDKLTNVQSGGSWFHYYRDETEGAYIGQAAADGQVRVWSCKTGTQMNIAFAISKTITITSAGSGYSTAPTVTFSAPQTGEATNRATGVATINSSGQLTGITVIDTGTGYTSAPSITITGNATATCVLDNTFVQNYLTTSEPENLQFLTINDTTFVCNRDGTNARKQYTTVGVTGKTDNTPHAHYAFVELLRTENGRQYGLDLNNSTVVTTLNRATRLKIQDDNLDEGNGTGHCPGIGTQVFQNSKGNGSGIGDGHGKNLIFRINTLGQQGVSPDYQAASNGPDGDNYRCSYNREVVLLHGGEGWSTDTSSRDTTAVLTAAAGGHSVGTGGSANGSAATYDIRVEDFEATQINATITADGDHSGLIRPSPTPFDADTAVTADTIIGGIRAEIESKCPSILTEHIGNGIYLHSDNPFTVSVIEDDLMRSFQSSVNDVQSLPNQCKHGYIVKVSNALRSEEDDYYLRFEGQNEKNGSGSWVECAEPNIDKELTNMPLVIQRTALDAQNIATFTVKQYDYQVRRVGDKNTNPLPSFVNQRINKVLFFRNRLVFLSGENVITSRPGTLDIPDFFAETALTVSAADPIDIAAASMFPSELFDGIEINTGLVVFSTNQQFLLSSDDTVLNPDTAKLRSISTFNYNKDMPPISLGTTVGYVDNSGKFSRFNEMANIRREGEPDVVEVSKIVPTLLPKDIDLLTNSRENSIILMGQQSTQFTSTVNLLADSQAVPNASGSQLIANPFGVVEDIPYIDLTDTSVTDTSLSSNTPFFKFGDNIVGTPNQIYTGSIWVRTDTDVGAVGGLTADDLNANQQINYTNPNSGDGLLQAYMHKATTTWTRIGNYGDDNGTAAALELWFRPNAATNTSAGYGNATKIYLWGAQLEEGQGISTFERTSNPTDTSLVYGYKYLNVGDQRRQAAWFKWKFNNPLLYHFVINDEYFFLDTDHFLHTVKLVQESTDPSISQDNVEFLLHLDNHTTVSGGVYSPSLNLTTFSGVGWLTNVTTHDYTELVVVDATGRYGKPTVSGAQFTLPGNWQGLTLTIGYIYDYEVKLPRLYPLKVKDKGAAADVHASLIIHRIKLHFGKIGLYETTLERVGKVKYTEVYESTQLQEYDAGDAPYLEEFIKTVPVYERNTNVDIILKSKHPAPTTLRALSWEGDYSPRFYQRV